MLEIAALMLCKIGGKDGSADEIKAVIEAAGGSADEDALTKLLGDVDGKDINELLAAGMDKLKDVPMGGGGGGGGGGAAAGGDAAAVEEEKEEEEEEEADIGGGMDMFGGDGDDGGY
uniref:60S acidic ribosomal protein P2 n=1 Tax=Ditylum brightwellii TaxID=49249 RepID=A0A6S8YTR9_9STRA|mmetsp:Transcript_24905/g.33011  ORF Transcript_24905/g.33011 Transcript_24905/m.33011 type:complete len:117 (+) Transcript_24905:57-407(+)